MEFVELFHLETQVSNSFLNAIKRVCENSYMWTEVRVRSSGMLNDVTLVVSSLNSSETHCSDLGEFSDFMKLPIVA